MLYGFLLIIEKTAALGNSDLFLMSAWIVGKVEAPAKANITELKAESKLQLKIEYDIIKTFAKIKRRRRFRIMMIKHKGAY